ncbi:hypothetical protein AXK12_07965 [Cephaloticoccus capnophilus]|uniref:PEP-CTERM protein-sorting domain-containing protein n=1 Tax=Cephaloticoccus capnophilus TaxID=1548208 RepID=A0A139SI26_9BACT|nr:hypothetical protein AXK12_07965 [Cephaloticoccus capnophilus]
MSLTGDQANTFTGDVIVEGRMNTLHLNKSDGVTSILGNIFVRKLASVNIVSSDQIADSSTVTLSERAILSFSAEPKAIREKIHALVVKEGTSRLSFYHSEGIRDNFKKTLILDDLLISDDGFLQISGWEAGRDHLLVRKDSEHLADAFKKITIDGWAKNQVYLKDYDKEYWSIEAAPEPSTYGAILGAVGLGLVIYRKHRHRMRSACGEKLGGAASPFKGSVALRGLRSRR